MAQSQVNAERRAQRGSRVYFYDMYEINDGPNSLSVTVDTTFRRDPNGILEATDIGSGYTWKFSRRATIERKNNAGEKILPPGQNPSALFESLIRLGGARLVKVVTDSAGAAFGASCPQDQILREGPVPQCVTSPKWLGGGPGTVDPPYNLTSISNSCAIKYKSLVTYTYTVPATIGHTPISTSFCAIVGGTTELCLFSPGDTPGSSHARSATYTDGGPVFASLGFHWTGGDDNGAGSGNAPGCSLVGGCT